VVLKGVDLNIPVEKMRNGDQPGSVAIKMGFWGGKSAERMGGFQVVGRTRLEKRRGFFPRIEKKNHHHRGSHRGSKQATRPGKTS